MDQKPDQNGEPEAPDPNHDLVPPTDAGFGQIGGTYTASDETQKRTYEGGKPQKWYKKPTEISFDRYLELILTLAIAYFAYSQVRVAKNSSDGSTKQLDKIIIAADRINDAADSFSSSSANISRGIQDAVSQLTAQSQETRNFSAQSRQQFIQDQRPYIAQESSTNDLPHIDAYPSISGLTQIAWNYQMRNFGKSPAYKVSVEPEMSLDGGAFVKSYAIAAWRSGETYAMAQGDRKFGTVYSAPLLPQEADRLVNKIEGIKIRIKLRYEDRYGSTYETLMCFASAGKVSGVCYPSYIH